MSKEMSPERAQFLAQQDSLLKGWASCNGHGTIRCTCGGDLCVCGINGEDCGGCDLCDPPLDEDQDA